MKRLIYCIIIAIGMSLAFSGGKPCCNKKAGNIAVACKFNHVAIGVEKDAAEELTAETADGDQKSFICNRAKGSKCAQRCAEKPWWKFWAKKSTKNCPCRQADITETILQNKR
jgi:hypothetical protein